MRVFVTGATGWVGSAVVQELLSAGHEVLGLARTEERAAALAATGAQVRRGTIEELELLREAAASADGVVHCAFNHDFSRFAENCEADRRAIGALADGLAGSARPLLVTGGLAYLAPSRPATEDDRPPPPSERMPRMSEAAADAAAERGVNAAVVRLAPSVHGEGDHGFVPLLVELARRKGEAAFIGEGLNRWPGVHRLDAARLYRLALEKPQRGGRWHAVDEEGVPFRDIAAAIGRGLGVPVVSKSGDEVAAHFGWFAAFAAMDAPASNARTRAALGWAPTRPGLLEDLALPSYFVPGQRVL
ncbi:MAG: SDR family oxidoreductase [Burkholderiaceae bacterium]